MPAPPPPRYQLAVVAARENVKAVKSALQERGVFGRVVKRWEDVDVGEVVVVQAAAGDGGAAVVRDNADVNDCVNTNARERFVLFTTLEAAETAGSTTTVPHELTHVPHIVQLLHIPVVSASTTGSSSSPIPTTSSASTAASPLYAAIKAYLALHPPSSADHNATPDSSSEQLSTLLSTAPRRYSFYPPLLLLPTGTFSSPPWKRYLSLHPGVLDAIASSVPGVTHIAVNAPIRAESVVRSPERLWKLHPPSWANATPPIPPSSSSSLLPDFSSALWVSTTQSGVYQTWPPEHVMFSRGNITEKARVQALENVRGRDVADLYAGIGYFVFSYLRAGARTVYAWELNPWSVEALKRGAEGNGWDWRIVREGEEWQDDDDDDAESESEEKTLPEPHQQKTGKKKTPIPSQRTGQVVIFHESNIHAASRLHRRLSRPPPRLAHINLGYLPSSRPSWPLAVELVYKRGGVVHVHENVREQEIDDMADEVVREMRRMCGGLVDGGSAGIEVACEKVVRVKTFAPGVWHCVYDVRFRRVKGGE